METLSQERMQPYFKIEKSPALMGEVTLEGAKNAVLVIMASLLLTDGVSILRRVPPSADVFHMIRILELLGAAVVFDAASRTMTVDTGGLRGDKALNAEIMGQFRASTLVLGPLLARFGSAYIALPGGDAIGKRPIDLHLHAFEAMGAHVVAGAHGIAASAKTLVATTIVLAYPSVGATENSMMAAALICGETSILNAAIEPEVMDLALVLRKMGARVVFEVPGTVRIQGVTWAMSVDHEIMFDRLEAGTFLLAAAITGGTITIPQAPVEHMAVFLSKLREMGHRVIAPQEGGVVLEATHTPRAISIRTMPHPGFPTDLQGPMLVAQALASGTGTIHETVYERRFGHVRELQRMGAQITVLGDFQVFVQGGGVLHGSEVIAGDIRAAAALTLAGIVAHGTTRLFGLEHIQRGYVDFVTKLQQLGACICVEHR